MEGGRKDFGCATPLHIRLCEITIPQLIFLRSPFEDLLATIIALWKQWDLLADDK